MSKRSHKYQNVGPEYITGASFEMILLFDFCTVSKMLTCSSRGWYRKIVWVSVMLICLLRDMFYATIHCIDFLHSGVNSILICFFVFDYNINHYNTLKMKRELFLFVFLSVFITLIDLGTQVWGTQTRYTVVNFGLKQPLCSLIKHFPNDHRRYSSHLQVLLHQVVSIKLYLKFMTALKTAI